MSRMPDANAGSHSGRPLGPEDRADGAEDDEHRGTRSQIRFRGPACGSRPLPMICPFRASAGLWPSGGLQVNEQSIQMIVGAELLARLSLIPLPSAEVARFSRVKGHKTPIRRLQARIRSRRRGCRHRG